MDQPENMENTTFGSSERSDTEKGGGLVLRIGRHGRNGRCGHDSSSDTHMDPLPYVQSQSQPDIELRELRECL